MSDLFQRVELTAMSKPTQKIKKVIADSRRYIAYFESSKRKKPERITLKAEDSMSVKIFAGPGDIFIDGVKVE